MSDLYRLVYASKNLLRGSEAEVTATVMRILGASQRNNARSDVTGALMFNAGAFAQVLEGPQRGVEETFERIQCDDRHGDVTVLQCGPAESRSFTNWSMAFVGQSAGGQARFSRLAAESGFDLSRLDGDAVFAMLHGLVLEEEGVELPASAAPTDGAGETRTEARAETRPATGLDVGQVRAEIAQLRPDIASVRTAPDDAPPTVEPARPSRGATDTALGVLKTALAAERQRTGALRSEIDVLQIELAQRADEIEAVRAERDRWAERARLLATAMAQEAGEVRTVPSPGSSAVRTNGRARPDVLADALVA